MHVYTILNRAPLILRAWFVIIGHDDSDLQERYRPKITGRYQVTTLLNGTRSEVIHERLVLIEADDAAVSVVVERGCTHRRLDCVSKLREVVAFFGAVTQGGFACRLVKERFFIGAGNEVFG